MRCPLNVLVFASLVCITNVASAQMPPPIWDQARDERNAASAQRATAIAAKNAAVTAINSLPMAADGVRYSYWDLCDTIQADPNIAEVDKLLATLLCVNSDMTIADATASVVLGNTRYGTSTTHFTSGDTQYFVVYDYGLAYSYYSSSKTKAEDAFNYYQYAETETHNAMDIVDYLIFISLSGLPDM